ncbi:hypothetical protein EUX98_g7996 [Antrodiella citrinella]|uniref:Cytochrome c oxidase assembly factor 3 n=1 Tax=Antrodiella citrinella TaxID=2447956 RepID=A0A4S4MD08_9APHY|nr:hypothetical protein EUX98_g7996 [Antrodiella citrinella]
MHLQLMSPGLQRARAPFRMRNALTGLILAGFATGVWAYSISAVKQDDFSDIDEEAKALAKANPPAVAAVSADSGAGADVNGHTVVDTKAGSVRGVDPVSVGAREASVRRGLLVKLLEGRRWGERVLDPTSKTLVWGAPPVDNVGRLGEGASRR